MTATTSRYGMTYPTGGDPLSSITTLFKNMCDSIDKALAQVDDRNNVGGVKPIVRATLAELKLLQGVSGQVGYVTNDPDELNNGAWHFAQLGWKKQTADYVTLYDAPSAALNSTALLTRTAADFDMLIINYKTDDNFIASAEIYKPNGKNVTLTSSTYNPQGGAVWVKSKTVRINGTTINTLQQGTNAYYTGQVAANGSNGLQYGDYIGITSVIGVKLPREA